MVTIVQLSPNAAGQALQNDGAAALGLTAPLISPVWSSATPSYDDTALTLSFASAVQVPFLGILETIDTPNDVFDVSGAPIPVPVTRIRLHPQAAARLITLAEGRYAQPGQPMFHPVPTQMVIRDVTLTPLAPQWWEPGDSTARTGAVSLHDRRGLIICPVAAAAMLADLAMAFPALLSLSGDAPQPGVTVASAGGLTPISGLDSGLVVHVVDPHGARFQPPDTGHTVTLRTGDSVTETLTSTGLIDLAPGQTLRASPDDDAAETAANQPDAPDTATGARLRWGWSNGGQLARTPLDAPDLPAGANPAISLPRQFLRLTVADMHWHLLGNRTTSTVQGIARDDGLIPEAYQPKVRPDLPIDYLADGAAVLAEANQVVQRLDGVTGGFIVAVSPVLEPNVLAPPAADATGRWPAFPPPDTGLGFPTPVPSPANGMTAAFTADDDVVVTIQAGQVPNGAHVRIYPRQFVEIAAIGEQPSFLRGDGGAGIAGAGALQILLGNPFALLEAQPRPSPANLMLDIVVTPRLGDRRLFANQPVSVADGPVAAPPDPFAGGVDFVSAIADFVGSVAPVPLFGMPRPAPPPLGPDPSVVDLLRQLGSETQPREGPRLPTQARFETMMVTGIPDPGATGGMLSWEAVLSGGRWSGETRSSRHREGNPGNPAGPDVHASGVKVGGDLALDVARQALHRAQPIIPTGETALGWIVMQGGNNFNRPSFLAPGAGSGANAGAGALLKSVAAVCETPELSLTGFPLPTDSADFQQMLLDLQTAMGIANPQPDFLTVANEDRLATEVVKEFYHSRHGTRDALWALTRAFGQARELVYIESPQFARTARADGPPEDHEIDLAQTLADRMTAMPSLRVAICLPRAGDFAPVYQGFVRQAIAARQEAIGLLNAVDEERVIVFHPKGFPGRAAEIRSTTVIVDDCWSMVGASHLRRRGMTFDGAADIVSMPYALGNGYASGLAAFRRDLMARKLGLEPTLPADRQGEFWARLAEPLSAFKVFADLLDQDGAGMITPLWPGPDDNSVLPATHDMADPDGTDGASFVATFAGFLNENAGDA
ncbi:MAG: hypothetical protein AAGD47_02040 [Pseudomonadota bacterium]